MATPPFIHPMTEIDLGIVRSIKGMVGQDPTTSYLTDSRQSVDKTMKKIQEIKANIHPLGLQWVLFPGHSPVGLLGCGNRPMSLIVAPMAP